MQKTHAKANIIYSSLLFLLMNLWVLNVMQIASRIRKITNGFTPSKWHFYMSIIALFDSEWVAASFSKWNKPVGFFLLGTSFSFQFHKHNHYPIVLCFTRNSHRREWSIRNFGKNDSIVQFRFGPGFLPLLCRKLTFHSPDHPRQCSQSIRLQWKSGSHSHFLIVGKWTNSN